MFLWRENWKNDQWVGKIHLYSKIDKFHSILPLIVHLTWLLLFLYGYIYHSTFSININTSTLQASTLTPTLPNHPLHPQSHLSKALIILSFSHETNEWTCIPSMSLHISFCSWMSLMEGENSLLVFHFFNYLMTGGCDDFHFTLYICSAVFVLMAA